MPQAIGGFQFRSSCLASSYWGIAISRVSFCPKLLGECNFESPVLRQKLLGELQFGSFAVCQTAGEFQLVGNCAVCQVNRQFQLVRLFCPKLLGECNFEVPVLFALCQAIEDVQLVLPQAIGDSCLVSSYWGITICRGLRCVKLLGITTCRVLQAIG